MPTHSKLGHFVETYRSHLLAGVLVAEMLISPAVDYHPHLGAVLAGCMWLVVILAARYMAGKGIVRRVILPLAALWVVARLLEAFGDERHFYARLAPVMGLALSCALLWGISERRKQVTPGTAIAESFIAYLLIATMFAQVYWIFNIFVAQPFNEAIQPHQIATLLYFSMVTISTVGYGHIVPLNPYVRMVAAFESITGVFYLAVVVARLVSAYESSRHAER
jgi:Ion channel